MTRLKFLGAAVLLALLASPASAQHMIDEPGMFAFVHPNGDLGIGTSRPPSAARAARQGAQVTGRGDESGFSPRGTEPASSSRP